MAGGAPDPKWGEQVVAVVVPKPGSSLSLDEARAFLDTGLARYKLPRSLHLIDTMPRNPNGKVAKLELRRRFAPAPPR